MPTSIQNAKIALLGSSLDHLTKKATDWDKKYVIETLHQFHEFMKSERTFYRYLVDGLAKIGVSVVFCRKRISDLLISSFAEKNILACSLSFNYLNEGEKITLYGKKKGDSEWVAIFDIDYETEADKNINSKRSSLPFDDQQFRFIDFKIEIESGTDNLTSPKIYEFNCALKK